MKTIYQLIITVGIMFMFGCGDNKPLNEDKPLTRERQLYQLKTYYFETSDQMKVTDQYLKDAFLPALHRMEITPVGIFKPRPSDDDHSMKTLVLIPFTSFNQLLTLDGKLSKDEAYSKAGRDYINAPHDDPPYKRVESIILHAFKNMPNMKTPELESPRQERIYELRSYESATEADLANKIEMFNEGGEVSLFKQLEFNPVFFGEVVSGCQMPNMMYMTTFSDQESREGHWNAFRESPEWKKLKAKPQYQNNVSHIDIHFLYPTDYSDY